MWLVLRLIVRLVGVVALCLALALAWAMVDTHRTIDRETSASADRVAAQLEILYWRELLWRGGLRKEASASDPGMADTGHAETRIARASASLSRPGPASRRNSAAKSREWARRRRLGSSRSTSGCSDLRQISFAPSPRANPRQARSSPLPILKPRCGRPGFAFPRSPILRRRWRWPSLCLLRWPSLTRSRRPPRLSQACARWRSGIIVGVCRRFERASLR